MDKELQRLMRGAAIGKGAVDKLIQIYSCEGKASIVLLHLEIQNQHQSYFPQRLFEYYCRLYLRYKRPILVLVILTDDSRQWRPEKYQSIVWEQPVIDFYFYPNKVLDYRGREMILAESQNPFAWVVLVHLAAMQTKRDFNDRFQKKFSLVRRLYERDFSRDMVIALLTFMDWVLTLPESLEIKYNQEIQQFEEAHNMTYITSFERIGIQKGIQQGLQQGLQQGECVVLERLLQRKFPQLPPQYLAMLHKADAETLLKWSEAILEAKSLAEIFEE